MARRNFNHKMLENADISANVSSNRTNVENTDQAFILVSWTGVSPVGVITIEASNSSDQEFTKGTEIWETLDFGASIDVSGNSGTHQINFTQLSFRAIRFVYTATSGTGTLTAHINGNSIGA